MAFDYKRFITVPNTHRRICQKFDYLLSKGLDEYKSEALSLFSLPRFPNRNDDNIIEQIIPSNLHDLKNKLNEIGKNYYISNAICFLQVTNKILDPNILKHFNRYSPSRRRDLVLYNYCYLFQELLFDSVLLLKDYEENINRRKSRYTLWRNPIQQTVTIYKHFEQSYFGQASYHSHADREILLSSMLLRQLIELRIRRAFSLIALENISSHNIKPVSMNIINSVLVGYKSKIDFSVPYHNIIRIYNWLNIFTHSGIKDYSWKQFKCYLYLTPFFVGRDINGAWDYRNGISLSARILKRIQAETKREAENKDYKSYRWQKYKPEATLL